MKFSRRIQSFMGVAAIILGGTYFTYAWAQTPRKPNVVVIMVDSMGYGDSEPYGATEIRTPSLNRLAREGVRLTDGYANGSVCTPTRAAFITGRYQQRVGLEWALVKDQNKSAGLSASEMTLAKLLKQGGYATGVFGKWHLGYQSEFGPNAHGFDEFFGFLDWSVDYYTHKNIDGEPDLYENAKPVEQTGYMTDLITEHAVAFIDRHAGEPFFSYVAYNAMVSPIQPPGIRPRARIMFAWLRELTRESAAFSKRSTATGSCGTRSSSSPTITAASGTRAANRCFMASAQPGKARSGYPTCCAGPVVFRQEESLISQSSRWI